MSIIRKYFVLIIVLLLSALGISIQMKAAVGIAPFDALTQTVAYIFGMRVGDIATIFSIGFVIAQILILRKNTNQSILLQFFVGVLLGQFINYFYYGVFGGLVIESYILRLFTLIMSSLWVPIFVGAIMVLNLVTLPFENFAMVISKYTNFSFGQIRQALDILCIVLSVVLTLSITSPFTIREGTIISALTFGPLLSLYMPTIEKTFKKWDLIN